jgi:hypothetical protein
MLAAGDGSVMPKFAFAGGVQLGFSLGALRVNLSALEWAPKDVRVREGAGAQLEYWSVGVGVCYLLGGPALQAGPCARIELGRLSGAPIGIDSGRPGGARTQAVALGGQLRFRVIPPVWLMLDVGAEWIERRPSFVVSDYGPLFQPARFGVRSSFGPLLIW